MPDLVSSRYRNDLAAGRLAPDPEQEPALHALGELADALTRSPERGGGRLSRLLGRDRRPPAPRGVYLWGGVGRGKTMLMDLFFDAVAIERKRRVHFHAFMLEVHARLHAARTRAGRVGDDAVREVARAIAREARLLCFDEFHVEDVADAMILGRLFTAVFEAGTTVVATSNRQPEDLYKDGLQRALFAPFIALLKERTRVIRVGGDHDHRIDRLIGDEVHLTPLGPETTARMDRLFARLGDGAPVRSARLSLGDRCVEVPRAARDTARFTFHELCGRPLGPADLLAIADAFHVVMIDDVPVLTEELRNEAKRLITLVDALYERRAKLIVSAAVPVERLHTGHTHAFEFERTTSRLIEMRSADYARAPLAA